jgi:hypothetical protein
MLAGPDALGAMEAYLERIIDQPRRDQSFEIVAAAIAHLGGTPPVAPATWAVEAFDELLATAQDLQKTFRTRRPSKTNVSAAGTAGRRSGVRTCLHGCARTPWCADILVCAKRALVRHSRRMDVYVRAGRQVEVGRWSPLVQSWGYATHERAPVSTIWWLAMSTSWGTCSSPCSRSCPPPGTCLERPHGGRQRVPRQVQVVCTIANMGQAGTDGCGLTRTCAVVANCHHRGTCGFAPTCRAVRAGPPPASGLIRTAAVVPIRHHRVTWGSTEPPTRHWPIPALENKPDNNGSAKLAGPYDLGRYPGPPRRITESRCR